MKLGSAALHSSGTMNASHNVASTLTALTSGLVTRIKHLWADHIASLELARFGALLRSDVGLMSTDPIAHREHDRAHISAWVS